MIPVMMRFWMPHPVSEVSEPVECITFSGSFSYTGNQESSIPMPNGLSPVDEFYPDGGGLYGEREYVPGSEGGPGSGILRFWTQAIGDPGDAFFQRSYSETEGFISFADMSGYYDNSVRGERVYWRFYNFQESSSGPTGTFSGNYWFSTCPPVQYCFQLNFTSGPLSGQSFTGSLTVSDSGDGTYTPNGDPRVLFSFDVTVDGVSFSKIHDNEFPSYPSAALSGGVITLLSFISDSVIGTSYLYLAYEPGTATNAVEYQEGSEAPRSYGTISIVPCP